MTKPLHVTRSQAARLQRNLEGQGKPDKHLRVKTENSVGHVETFVARCGFRSTRRLEVAVNLKVVSCPKCLDGLGQAVVKSSNDDVANVGDVFEFDYTYRDERTEVTKLVVVDVTDTHIWYKMPSVSFNKIYPMEKEFWLLNQDERRPA